MEPESEKVEDTEKEVVEAAQPEETKEAPQEEATESVDYSSMTVAELKELLKAAGKPVSGKKADLISRLEE
jgi:hypothetical protein